MELMELRPFLKKLFGRRKAVVAPECGESSQCVRLSFTSRYLNFRTLLSTNNKILEIISDMEQALAGNSSFSMAFVKANCTAISVNMYKIISSLNGIAGQRYQELYTVFEGIWQKIDNELKIKKQTAEGELVLSLETIDKTMMDQVGNKMANLGEVRNKLGLPVPEGFAVTASAYRHFLEHTQLQDEINRRIQSLEPDNTARLHESSAEIQKLITNAPVPPRLEKAILGAYSDVEEKAGKGINISVRSSAIGEDTGGASFAGQYRSILNIGPDSLLLAYKEVVASKYSVPAMSYRLNKGFRDEDIPMCVGCMVMADAKSGGVMYSADPTNEEPESIIINAVPGLGKPVVEGTVTPDMFIVSKQERQITKKKINLKEKKFVCYPGEGVCRLEVVEGEREAPAITDEAAHALADISLKLERYFGVAQDIEWVIEKDDSIKILQSRPLMIFGREWQIGDAGQKVELPAILKGGVTGSPGVASGPAFLIQSTVDMLQFPKGSILVARDPLPQWAAVLNSAAAVITDRGGMTGHLAAVAREFKIPALLGTETAMKSLQNGRMLTVDADNHCIYEGLAEEVLKRAAARTSSMKGSPVYNTLADVLKHIAPLNLTDPDGANFNPRGCRTIHDITRFAHEVSLRELFDYKKEISFSDKLGKRLTVTNIPMQWWVINLDEGDDIASERDITRLEEIRSVPMLALWEGITAIPWKGPPRLDTKGFISIMYEATMDQGIEPGVGSRFADKNYFIISEKFCHLSSRFGFHFSTVEAFISERAAENYVCLNFKGGAADNVRRERRAELIRQILSEFGFWVKVKEDLVFARLERHDQEFMKERLKILGHIVMHTRQLDMVLSDLRRVEWYKDEMIREIYSLFPNGLLKD